MGSVQISLNNGQLGATLQTNDGICGMILHGVAEPAYTLGTPVLLTDVTSLSSAGITPENNPFAIKNVREFYNQAGPGAQLYLMLLPVTMTIDHITNAAYSDGAKILLDFAGGAIKILGVMSDDNAITTGGGTVAVSHGLNTDVAIAAGNMFALANDYFAIEKPFRAIIGGTSYSGVAAALTDQTTGTNNRVAILIGDTDITYSTNGAALGLCLGAIASIPVQRKISRVRSGALTNTAAYLGAASLESTPGGPGIIAGKGYITFTTYPNVSGYFFSGDPMITAPTDDYSALCRGRVIDKAHILAYTTFIQEVDDEVPVNSDGTLDAGFCKWLEQQIVNQINNTMTANKEISSVNCYIDPTQNIISTSELDVVLKVTPVGYATEIYISLGFNNPAL